MTQFTFDGMVTGVDKAVTSDVVFINLESNDHTDQLAICVPRPTDEAMIARGFVDAANAKKADFTAWLNSIKASIGSIRHVEALANVAPKDDGPAMSYALADTGARDVDAKGEHYLVARAKGRKLKLFANQISKVVVAPCVDLSAFGAY